MVSFCSKLCLSLLITPTIEALVGHTLPIPVLRATALSVVGLVLVRHVLNRFSDQDYDELIGMLDGGLKEVLEDRTQDELTQCFLRMIWPEPRLITLGAQAFLKSLV